MDLSLEELVLFCKTFYKGKTPFPILSNSTKVQVKIVLIDVARLGQKVGNACFKINLHPNSKLNILGQKHENSFICLLKWLKFQNPGYVTENASCELILIVSPNLFEHYIILNNISTLFNECSLNLARNVNVNPLIVSPDLFEHTQYLPILLPCLCCP